MTIHKKQININGHFFTMSAMTPQQQKPLRINLGAVKRLVKEVASYEEELKEAQANVESSKYEPGSPEMKRLVNMRQECEDTLHDVERRLADFKKKLEAALKDVESQFPDDPMVIEAKQILGH